MMSTERMRPLKCVRGPRNPSKDRNAETDVDLLLCWCFTGSTLTRK